jgi:amidohydrolase
MSDFYQEAQDLFDYTRRLRRDFHRHPELGFHETRTASIVAEELAKLGMKVRTGVGRTGVLGLLEGSKAGPVVLLRFDMDALPINEESGAEYASENPGVMHACGHDGHMAIGLSVAHLLTRRRSELNGTIKFVFQPAEEGLGGAHSMIEDGVLEQPKPDVCLAMHLWNERPVGWLALVPGPFMAGSDLFRVRLTGKGGHGALPHETVDPVLAAAQVITALQSIVSRNVSPLQTAVVSVTQVSAGDAFNVIPAEARLQGTIRAFEAQVREKVLARFEEIVHGVAGAMGCQAEIEMLPNTPAVVNDLRITKKLQGIVEEALPDAIVDDSFRTMVSEDMAEMMERIPGCYFMVGSGNAERGLNASHHSPAFDFDEAALPRAVAFMCAAAMELLRG